MLRKFIVRRNLIFTGGVVDATNSDSIQSIKNQLLAELFS